MNPGFSLYLDAVRFAAAVLVVLYHTNLRWLISEPLPFAAYGHSAVVVFFVLSGYVISFVSSIKETSFEQFAVSRLARVYSVALPAVFLTPCLDLIGRSYYPLAYEGLAPVDWVAIRMLASLSFTNELWTVSILSFSNTPYWSLCYEVWYYIIFAVVVYTTGVRRLLLLFTCTMIAGIKILLLAPVWWMGVLLHRSGRMARLLAYGGGWPAAIASILGIFAMHEFGVQAALSNVLRDAIGEHLHTQLFLSKFFMSDMILGLLVMTHFGAVRAICNSRVDVVPMAFDRAIRAMAGYTFTLYLLHQPLFLFWGAMIRGNPQGTLFYGTTIFLLVASVILIGELTEKRRGLIRGPAERLFSRVRLVFA